MKALVLAAGLGTRIRETYPNIPKPLLPINGVPLLRLIMDKLIHLEVDQILVNSHYLPEQVRVFVSNLPYKDRVEILYEPNLLGTAGTLKKNISFLSEDHFLVLHGDNFFQDNLTDLVASHLVSRHEMVLSVGTILVDKPDNFGTFKIDLNSTVQNFYEKDKNSPFRVANSAVYVMKPSVHDAVTALKSQENDISKHLLPKLLGRMLAVPLRGHFFDIGTPENYKKAQEIVS